MAITIIRYWGSNFKRAGHSDLFARIFREAAVKGWRSCLVCSHPPEDSSWLEPLREVGTQIEYLPRPRRNFDVGCMRRVARLCRKLKCDVFHCDNMHTSPLIGSTLARVPVRLWSKRAMNPVFETGRKPTFRDRLVPSLRLSCWLATKTLAVSRAVKDELVELGIAERRLMVLPNPVDIKPPGSLDRDGTRAALGYSDGEFVISTVGHAVPVKGWDVLLRAFGAIAGEVPEARLLFVGSTVSAEEKAWTQVLRKTIMELRLSARVRFVGDIDDVPSVLAASDLFVLPSRSEGYGMALTEALAGGLPCIATRVGVAPDLIRDGQNGFLVAREDAKALADYMLRLARDKDDRERMSRVARSERVAPSTGEYASRVVALYETLLA